MENNIEKLEDQLFDDWFKKDPKILRDGVFDADKYCISKPRILYVLKEPWMEEIPDKRNLLDTVRNGDVVPTWTNLTRWTIALQKFSIGQFPVWKDDLEFINDHDRRNTLQSIAMMDLKKTPGATTSDMDEIQAWAKNNYELLRRQLAIYNPDIIICCGSRVCDILRNDVCKIDKKWQMTKRGIYYFCYDGGNGKKIPAIDFVHPQQRNTKNSLLAYALIDAWSELRQ